MRVEEGVGYVGSVLLESREGGILGEGRLGCDGCLTQYNRFPANSDNPIASIACIQVEGLVGL